MTKVTAIKCPKCGDTIYSRALHDFHSCSCKSISVDGGFEYFGMLFAEGVEEPVPFQLDIEPTPMELFEDWNSREDKYGRMPK